MCLKGKPLAAEVSNWKFQFELKKTVLMEESEVDITVLIKRDERLWKMIQEAENRDEHPKKCYYHKLKT